MQVSVIEGKHADDVQINLFINLYVMCKNLNQLPRPGGLLDQDYILMWAFSIIMQAESERERIETERAKHRNSRRR